MSSVSEKTCPHCHSKNTAPAEREYKTDYPFWLALAVVFILIGIALALFFLLQLHPVILILTLVAIVTKLLDTANRKKRRRKKVELICLDCDRRFTIFEKNQEG
ncbi:MAG: hypothetical protein JSV96_03355 [Candidatus Aminicenantes bacterium]|nr:MAG: hypothetical protein JSV96_03355 [Candidatus Aminicenantes bacterium]